MLFWVLVIAIWMIGVLAYFCFYEAPDVEGAEVTVDMQIVAQIESSCNPMAYNERTQATGMYQITPICLADYNNYHKGKFNLQEMFEEEKARKVARWYCFVRVPQLLKHYGFVDTLDNRLIAYNYGIGNMKKNKHLALPKETREYLLKYKKLRDRKELCPRADHERGA